MLCLGAIAESYPPQCGGPALADFAWGDVGFEEASGVDVRTRFGDSPALAATLAEEGKNSPADMFFAQDAGSLDAVEKRNLLLELPAQRGFAQRPGNLARQAFHDFARRVRWRQDRLPGRQRHRRDAGEALELQRRNRIRLDRRLIRNRSR